MNCLNYVRGLQRTFRERGHHQIELTHPAPGFPDYLRVYQQSASIALRTGEPPKQAGNWNLKEFHPRGIEREFRTLVDKIKTWRHTGV
jgi:hypothetical protein